jgi:hypothetical protein
MNKIICLAVMATMLFAGPLMAIDEDVFRSKLLSFNKVAIPVTAMQEKGSWDNAKGKGQSSNNGEFPYLTAAKLNQQIEVLIKGIETAKGVATALAVITNLYQSNQISVEVALTAVQILKLRAVFMKIFVTNGNSELEIMIQVLGDHETELGKQAQAKKANVQINGRISAPAAASN